MEACAPLFAAAPGFDTVFGCGNCRTKYGGAAVRLPRGAAVRAQRVLQPGEDQALRGGGGLK